MKYSIMGFNQSKLLETDLDLTDITILNYIITACGTPNMYYKLDENDKPLVWVYHVKLMEDLPILRISEGTLRNRLSKLKQNGYIKSESVASSSGRGSRVYYGITELTMSLIYDVEDVTTSRKNDTVERPRHVKMTSDNILKSNDNKLKEDTISKDIVKSDQSKPKKLSLYDKCVNLINEYTDDEKLRNALIDYLKFKLSAGGGGMTYANQFKGVLNKLDTLDGDKVEIVNCSLACGWKNVYPLDNNRGYRSNNKRKFGEDNNISSEKVTDEELANGYLTNEKF